MITSLTVYDTVSKTGLDSFSHLSILRSQALYFTSMNALLDLILVHTIEIHFDHPYFVELEVSKSYCCPSPVLIKWSHLPIVPPDNIYGHLFHVAHYYWRLKALIHRYCVEVEVSKISLSFQYLPWSTSP